VKRIVCMGLIWFLFATGITGVANGAALGIVYAEELTPQTNSSATFATKKSITLAANTTYFIIVRADQRNTSSGGPVTKARILINSTEEVESNHVEEIDSVSSTLFFPFSYIQLHTTGGSTETVDYQIASDGAQTTTADTIVLLAIPLDDLTDGKDYKFGEQDDSASPVAHTTTFADRASITFTPDNANDDWLVMSWGHFIINGVSVNYEMRINRDSDTEVVPSMSTEGEDVAEILPATITRVYTLSAAEHTFTVQSRDGEVTAVNEHDFSRIFALRLNVFEDHVFDWTEAEFTAANDNTFEEVADLAVTPQTAGDWIFLGGGMGDISTRDAWGIRFNKAGTAFPVGQDGYNLNRGHDATDENHVFILGKIDLSASLSNMAADFRAVDKTRVNFEDRSFVGFSYELAGGDPPVTFKGQMY